MQFELHIQRQMKSLAPTPGRAERTTFLIPGGGGVRAPDPAWLHLAPAPSPTGARVKERGRERERETVSGCGGRKRRKREMQREEGETRDKDSKTHKKE